MTRGKIESRLVRSIVSDGMETVCVPQKLWPQKLHRIVRASMSTCKVHFQESTGMDVRSFVSNELSA